MKEILLAENSGFCFGVKQAMEKTEKEIEKKQRNETAGALYTWGPLIHNQTVTDTLRAQGVRIAENLDEVTAEDTLIVRSHGEARAFFEEADRRGIHVVDATCPFVKKIHDLVEEAYGKGYRIIILGDAQHPEVRGINGWCENSALVVPTAEAAREIKEDKLFVVCQTTIRRELLDEVSAVLRSEGKQAEIHNTICGATTLRQNSCMKLAKICDCFIVIGGKNSSNTQKLAEIAKKTCKKVYFVEKIEDLPLHKIAKYNKIGVAAGASTPECVIKEVIATMSENITEMNMMDLMDDIEKSLRLPRIGETVNGKVHQVTDKEIIVNMGCKKDGVIPKEEVTLEGDQKLTDLFKEGDEIQAKVIKTDDGDGVILLSKKKLEVNEHWNEIVEALENKSIINVKVVKQVNGGVIAAYKEVSGFIPLSQLSDKYVENAEEFIGQELPVRVTRVDQKRGRAVFSHKIILTEEKEQRMKEVWDKLQVGDIVEGTVMRFTDYGAFVDLGGIDGLLHISEMSWGRVENPKKVFTVGETVKVMIKDIKGEKIALTMKFPEENPWLTAAEDFAVGNVVTGKVARMTDFGAFVELAPGVDALLHVSQISREHVAKPSDVLTIGQEIQAKVVDFNGEDKKISLSMKALEAPAEEESVEE